MTTKKSGLPRKEKSILKAVGAIEAGAEKIPEGNRL